MKLLSASDWHAIQRRSIQPTFAAVMNKLRSEIADFLGCPLAVPNLPGGYYHDYFCPEHGVQLYFDPSTPTTHHCPIDNGQWQGERFDAAWRWFANNRLAEGAIRLALLWQMEKNPIHLQTVVRTLLDYAARYASYQQVPRTVANPGVATYTTLDEAVWVLPLVWAYDLVADQLTAHQQQQIAEQLFAAVANHLIQHHFGRVHNFACWHNAAIGSIGVILGRTDLVNFAIHGAFGFDRQVQEGVLSDGLWFEGSFSYHFYTVYALLSLVKATRHLPGYDLRQRPEVRAMLLAPIHAAYPDWSLPAPNDCWYFTSLLADCCHGVPPAPAFYEIGYAWYNEALFGQVLQRAYQQAPRDSLDALLFGRDELPSAPLSRLPSSHLPASGYAILRSDPAAASDAENQRYLLLKYGPHGGGHGHPDKLNLILHAYGQRFSPDLGTPGYGLDLFESWYRQTASHNTVVIDGRSQPPATGWINEFRLEGAFQVADASVTWNEAATPYQGVTMRRVVLARPTYFLDLFLVQAPRPCRMEWFYRNAGRFHSTVPWTNAPTVNDEGAGYQHLERPQQIHTNQSWQVDWQLNHGGLRLFAAGADGATMITGATPGNPPGERAITLIQRRAGFTAAFFSLFHPYGHVPLITAVEWLGGDILQSGWAGCTVLLENRREEWLIQSQAASMPVHWLTGESTAERYLYRLYR